MFQRIAITLTLLLPGSVRGHGDLHPAIGQLTQALAEGREDTPALLLERAGLYLTDGDLPHALADVTAARSSPATPAAALLLEGRIRRRMQEYEKAAAVLTEFLTIHPTHSVALQERAQTHIATGRHAEAMADLDAVINGSATPAPELIFDRLELTKQMLGEAAALTWLDTILTKHPLPVLEDQALQLEIQLGKTTSAAARIERLAARHPRPASLYLKLADLLHTAGDPAASQKAAAAGMRSLNALPEHLRTSPATLSLAEKLQPFLTP